MPNNPLKETARLLEVVHELRQKCPWDQKQTHESLVPYLLEEAYETVEAIEGKNPEDVREELGDLLLQITLHAEIASETGAFSFETVAKAIADKMVHRHPHIYGDVEFKDIETHLARWNKLKAQEKPDQLLLEGVPKALPALQLAQKYCKGAAKAGFDWPTIGDVFEKIQEEVSELRVEVDRKEKNHDDVEMEFGDFLFTLTRVASHLGVDAERALRRSALKFYDRFSGMEREFKNDGKQLSDLTLAEMEVGWNKQKAKK